MATRCWFTASVRLPDWSGGEGGGNGGGGGGGGSGGGVGGCNDGEGLATVMVMAKVATVMMLEKKFDLKKN